MSNVLASLSASDMKSKFAENRLRFENGRVNEILSYEVEGRILSVYSELQASLDVSYRYMVML